MITLVALFFIRGYYMDVIETLLPQIESGGMWPAISLGIMLFALVSVVNQLAIYRKIMRIWWRKE